MHRIAADLSINGCLLRVRKLLQLLRARGFCPSRNIVTTVYARLCLIDSKFLYCLCVFIVTGLVNVGTSLSVLPNLVISSRATFSVSFLTKLMKNNHVSVRELSLQIEYYQNRSRLVFSSGKISRNSWNLFRPTDWRALICLNECLPTADICFICSINYVIVEISTLKCSLSDCTGTHGQWLRYQKFFDQSCSRCECN